MGPATYRFLKTLVSPWQLEELHFAELVDVASKHYNLKLSPIVKQGCAFGAMALNLAPYGLMKCEGTKFQCQ